MKTFFTLLVWVVLAPLVSAQTAADKIAAGRMALTLRDLPTAEARFEEALALNPSAQAAGALLGMTRIANFSNHLGTQSFLDRLGIASRGRNIHDWTAEPPEDSRGEIIAPENFNLTEGSTFWLGTVIPASERARSELARVTNPEFRLTLTSVETGFTTTITIDRGDVLMAQALLCFAEFLGHAASGQNLDVNLSALWALDQNNALTVQRVFMDNPDLLKVGPVEQRMRARTKLLEGIALYREASAAIRGRTHVEPHALFEVDAEMLVEEADFRAKLDLIERSLTEPVTLDDDPIYVRLGAALDPTWSFRAALPTFTEAGFDFGSAMDPTFGGMVSGLTREAMANLLADDPDTLPELGWEWISPTPHGISTNSYVALPGGKHLVVGNAGAVMTSDDGIAWNTQRIPGAGALADGVSGLGRIVVVGERGIHVSSDAGVTWRRATQEKSYLRGVTFAAGRFVAVGDNGKVAVSTDGESWTFGNLPSFSGYDVIHTGARFVAVGQDFVQVRSAIVTSTDGINWTRRFTAPTAATNNWFYAVAASPSGAVVAVGPSNTRAVSADGISWSTGTVLTGAGSPHFQGITYYNGRFLAAGSFATGVVAASTDGVTWTSMPMGTTSTLTQIGAGAGVVYVTGNFGTILRSTDGAAFTQVHPAGSVLPASSPRDTKPKVIDDHLYVYGRDGMLARSSDGVSFQPIVSTTNSVIVGMAKKDGLYLAVGQTGVLLESTDGLTWRNRAVKVSYSLLVYELTPGSAFFTSIEVLNGKFVISGLSDLILTSSDGEVWTWGGSGVGGSYNRPNLVGAAYGNGTYVAVGTKNGTAESVILRSSDGVNWTERPSAVGNNSLRGVVFHNGRFTAVGDRGVIAQSVDGLSWSVRFLEGSLAISSVRVLGGYLYATENYAVLVSSDGEDWVRVPTAGALGSSVERFQERM